jgi:hypothetical protein
MMGSEANEFLSLIGSSVILIVQNLRTGEGCSRPRNCQPDLNYAIVIFKYNSCTLQPTHKKTPPLTMRSIST